MKIEKIVFVEEKEVEKYICDKCGKEGGPMSDVQPQIFSFGYGSKFDGKLIEFELCDNCVIGVLENVGKDEELFVEDE